MERHEYIHKSKKEIFINNLLGGVAWGIGATVGLSIVLALLSILGNAIGFVPIVGDFVSQVINYIQQNDPGIR